MRYNLLWAPIALLSALLAIYLPGLGNIPVFDDGMLTDGELFAEYGALWPLKPRLFSYGSFEWLQAVVGEGWWKQRLGNLAIHCAVVLTLWGFYRELLRHIQLPDSDAATTAAAVPYHQSPALGLAIGVFALNPVAVYAVAYLIQRSILLATLFVVLGLWSFMHAVASGRKGYYGLALLCYALALLSKEHAIMAPIAAVPLYILVARPAPRKLMALAGVGGLLVALMGLLLTQRYGDLVGKPFDLYSHIYLGQLAQLGPDVERLSYPLSIVNQAYFFFEYGVRWFIPNAGWMSIDMRPPFPLSLTVFPHVLGLVGYVALIGAGLYLLIRFRDWRALLGIAVLLPALLFMTEFATVWVQDPFVLYRSYLWAIGVPGLAFFLFHGLAPRALLVVAAVLGGLFVWQAADRMYSLATPERVWSDAVAKLPDDPRSVGRWFPYLNRGNVYLEQDRLSEAVRDFKASSALGDQGMGAFDIGALLFTEGKYRESLAYLDEAERLGYALPSLRYQRGLAYLALRRLPEALAEFQAALAKTPGASERAETLSLMGRVHLEMGRIDVAIRNLDAALKIDPRHKKARLSLGMANVMKKDYANARAIFTQLLGEGEHGQVYYGRALANFGLKNKAEALSDIENAIRLDPGNPNLQSWRGKIGAMP